VQPDSNLLTQGTLGIVVRVSVLRYITTEKIASAGLVPAYLSNLALLNLIGAAIVLFQC
jgi:hypothetical protein